MVHNPIKNKRSKGFVGWKRSYQAAKHLEDDAKTKYKIKTNFKPTCTLNGPGNNMNSYTVIQVQSKFMKATWLPTNWGGVRIKFPGTEKLSVNGKELDTFFALAATKAMKMNKNSKEKGKENSDSENEGENLNFEKLEIGADSDS